MDPISIIVGLATSIVAPTATMGATRGASSLFSSAEASTNYTGYGSTVTSGKGVDYRGFINKNKFLIGALIVGTVAVGGYMVYRKMK